MSQQIISTALYLPSPEIEALIQGRTIAVVPRRLLRTAERFALCPADFSTITLPVKRYYRASFSPLVQTSSSQKNFETVEIKAWGKCEFCQVVDGTESLEKLSPLTVWTIEGLQEMLRERRNIFLAYLRVYLLTQPLKMSPDASIEEKIGKFVSLSNSLAVSESSPVLSDSIFAQRRYQLENRISPLHPELEELQSQVAQIAVTNPDAETLNHHIQTFLGWVSNPPKRLADPDLSWIKTINDLGTATDGGNYERGTAFEQIVHKSLKFLGFELDQNARGGAGGMDLYCKKPYPLVGECKAGQSLGSIAVKELVALGGTHLGTDHFLGAVKLVIGPGKPSNYLLDAANKWKVSIINPMTLQKLVELQAKYPGSVNLIELKPYLESGQIDSKIDEYIQKVTKEIKLRSHLVTLIKNYLENTGMDSAGVEALHGAYFGSNPPKPITTSEMREILIELSSPLTGYLGRKKGSDGSDRFYYLRDLTTRPL